MLIFQISGPPVPQKQTQFVRATGRAYNPSQAAIEQLQWQIRPYAPSQPLAGAIEMHLSFYLPIPKSVSKRVYMQMINAVILPVKRPDFDNLAYLVTNAMKGIVYADDSQVTDCTIRKRYSDMPRTVIKIIEIEQTQPIGGSLCV